MTGDDSDEKSCVLSAGFAVLVKLAGCGVNALSGLPTRTDCRQIRRASVASAHERLVRRKRLNA